MSAAEASEDLVMLEQFYAKLYFHLAAEYLRTFGEPGREALSGALARFADDVCSASRPAHQSLGCRPHLVSLCRAGALPDEARSRPNRTYLEPHMFVAEAAQCPLYDSWEHMGGMKEGLVYCEVVSRAIWSACDAVAEIRQPRMLTKGDPLCRFEVRITNPREGLRSSQAPVEQSAEHLRRATDLTAQMYYYLALGLSESFGMEGEAALRRAIRRFGRQRGLSMRHQHLDQGREITMYNLFTYYDFPSDDRFRRNKIELTDETRLSETLVCPFHDLWKCYPDGDQLGRIYCEEVHHAIFSGYDGAVQTNLSTTLTQGDDRCRFAVYLRAANKVGSPR